MRWWGWCVVAALVFAVVALVAVLLHWTPLWAILVITGLVLCIIALVGIMCAMAPRWPG